MYAESPARKIHVISTQHFDIIWRRPISEYREIQAKVINIALGIIDQHPHFRFTFHQADVLRHFVETHPEEAKTLKLRVAEGSIEIIGGLETIADTNMSVGESLVRNIIMGKRWVKSEFGRFPKIASFDDCFGSSAQMPQILSKTGYDYLLPGRMPGSGLPSQEPLTPFVWHGIDGSIIKGVYFTAYIDPGANIEQQAKDAVEKFSQREDTSIPMVIRFLGEESLPREGVAQVVEELAQTAPCPVNYSSYTQVFDEVDWSKPQHQLNGECNVEFSGCYTTRIQVKQRNQRAETQLYNAEFLRAAEALAGKPKTHTGLDSAWRDLFLCQFHDALGGCHIDKNFHEIMEAFDRIGEATDLHAFSGSGDFTVLNTLPYSRRDLVRLPDRASSMSDSAGNPVPCQRDGDAVLFCSKLGPGRQSAYRTSTLKAADSEPASKSIRIGRYTVSAGASGPSITDGELGLKIFTDGRIPARIIAREDVGTLWTEKFTGLTAAEEAGDSHLESFEVGPVFTKLVYVGELSKKRVGWESFEGLSWRKTFYVYSEIQRIEVHIDLTYAGKGTETRVEFPVNVDPARAQARYDIPFGSLIREPYEPGFYTYGMGNWPALSWCDYSDTHAGFAIAHTGTYGCLASEGSVAFSLLRSATAYADNFPTIPEELSFDNGRRHYEFAIIPHSPADKTWISRAREFIVRPLVLPAGHYTDLDGLKLHITEPQVQLSAAKPAEDGRGIIIRIYETLGEACTTSIEVEPAVSSAIETSMDEAADGALIELTRLQLKPYEVKTIRLVVGR